MKIALFGADGIIGRRIAEEALARGPMIDELEQPQHIRQRFTVAY